MSENTIPLADRFLELIVVLLLGITTIGTAWCGFQATRWNGQSGDLTGVDGEVDVVQDVHGAEALVDALELQQRGRGHEP